MRVFIVDDSELMRERIIGLVSDVGDVQIAGQAESMDDSIQGIRDSRPDVLILDIHLKEGNGIELLKRIKKEPGSPVVIMLTNYPYPQYRETCETAGAEYFLDKSTEIFRLPEILGDLTAKTV